MKSDPSAKLGKWLILSLLFLGGAAHGAEAIVWSGRSWEIRTIIRDLPNFRILARSKRGNEQAFGPNSYIRIVAEHQGKKAGDWLTVYGNQRRKIRAVGEDGRLLVSDTFGRMHVVAPEEYAPDYHPLLTPCYLAWQALIRD